MTQIWNNFPINDPTQGVTGSGTGTVANSTNPADYLVEMITDLAIGLESQPNTGAGTSARTLLPSAAEPSGSSAALNVDLDALATMGDAVGMGMASASTPVNWDSFVQQTAQQFSAAGFSPSAIDTYLGAVMQGYTQDAPSVGPSTSTGVGVASSTPSFTFGTPGATIGLVTPATSTATS